MTTHEKALEAAIDACVIDLPDGGAEIDIHRAIAAYLSALLPEDVAGLVERLRQYEGRQWETTACYNGTRDEAASLIQSQAARIAELEDIVSRAQLNMPDHYTNWHSDARALLNGERKG